MALALRWIHVVAAITWVGGMLFIALVLVPVARRLEDAALRTRLIQAAGERFRVIAWSAFGIMVATGLGNLWFRPYLLEAPRLHCKLALVAASLALGGLHDFVLGPRAGRPGAPPAARVRAAWIARVHALVALAIVLLGLSLRG